MYFLIWIGAGTFLIMLSARQDQGMDTGRLTRRLQVWSGPGLVLYGFAVTFAAVDWVMSLEPHWYSTIYGVVFLVGQSLLALAFVTRVAICLANRPPLQNVPGVGQLRARRLRGAGMILPAAQAFAPGWAAGWRTPPALLVSEWAERNLVLSGKAASEPGSYRIDRTPFCREPMDTMAANSAVEEVVLIWGAQTGKSTIANACVAYWATVEPAPVMFVQPTLNLAKRYSRQRISPLIESTPALRDKFASNRSRDESNTTLMKDFEGRRPGDGWRQ